MILPALLIIICLINERAPLMIVVLVSALSPPFALRSNLNRTSKNTLNQS